MSQSLWNVTTAQENNRCTPDSSPVSATQICVDTKEFTLFHSLFNFSITSNRHFLQSFHVEHAKFWVLAHIESTLWVILRQQVSDLFVVNFQHRKHYFISLVWIIIGWHCFKQLITGDRYNASVMNKSVLRNLDLEPRTFMPTYFKFPFRGYRGLAVQKIYKRL